MKSHDITSGQPFDGVTFSGDTMDVKAGRHGSGAPAATFMAGVSVQNIMGLDVTLNMSPEALNFVVLGDMKFTFEDGSSYTCPDFRVAQGHSVTSNNWWVGSKDCMHVPETHQIKCCCGASHLCNPVLDNYGISITAGDNDHMFEIRNNKKSIEESFLQ